MENERKNPQHVTADNNDVNSMAGQAELIREWLKDLSARSTARKAGSDTGWDDTPRHTD